MTVGRVPLGTSISDSDPACVRYGRDDYRKYAKTGAFPFTPCQREYRICIG